ncbi:hypothetical protein N3K66_001539 [Trichothecium roseum]|uniref:Uncharacterized protein n=1 Tax=Trichothecium roseum TaxID=47278 RepID=A0ACC0VGP5_9HYPO|nr:hypothetical protein N3K66_001539 [Trichothecium roseum]
MTINAGYFPQYPLHDNLPDPEIRTFVTNFYQASDRPDSDELWISYFINDAVVTMGNDVGRGTQEIRELRGRMWTHVSSRKHTVTKVFSARFKTTEEEREAGEEDGEEQQRRREECELMLFGQVDLTLKDGGSAAVVPWAGHATVVRDTTALAGSGETKRSKGEWKFAQYRVWLQK